MELHRRNVVTAKVVIAELVDESLIPAHQRPKPMVADIRLALKNSLPETINDALESYVNDKWSSKPHKITRVVSITSSVEDIWAQA